MAEKVLTDKDKERAKKQAKKIQSAKKAVKLFESGAVEDAYKKALDEANRSSDETARKFKVSLVEEEQKRNIAIYNLAKFFLGNCQ